MGKNAPHTEDVESLLNEASGAYGRQIRDGYTLGFAADLEREYRLAQVHEARNSVPLVIAICLVAWIGLVGLDIWRLFYADFTVPARQQTMILTARVSALLILLLYFLPPIRARIRPDWALFISIASIGASATFAGAIYSTNAVINANSALIIIVMVAYLPLGMSLAQATAVAAFIIILTGALHSEYGFGVAGRPNDVFDFVLICASLIAGIAYVIRDRSERRKFLLERVLVHVAQHDPLTGLANRRLFTEHVHRALAQARRTGAPAVLALIDVDYFKRYNDTYGHNAGDEVLRQVGASIALAGARPLDIAARVGGEEFAIFLYGTDANSASRIVEELISDVRALAIPHSASDASDCVTVSVGVAEIERGDSLEKVYRNADEALYAAKDSGRNQFNVFQRSGVKKPSHGAPLSPRRETGVAGRKNWARQG